MDRRDRPSGAGPQRAWSSLPTRSEETQGPCASGTLRYGEKAPVIPEPHKKANCPEGWYELLAGGFVCGKYVTLDLDHPRFKPRKAPDLEAPCPTRTASTSRTARRSTARSPRARSAAKLEPWLARPKKAQGASQERRRPDRLRTTPYATTGRRGCRRRRGRVAADAAPTRRTRRGGRRRSPTGARRRSRSRTCRRPTAPSRAAWSRASSCRSTTSSARPAAMWWKTIGGPRRPVRPHLRQPSR